MLIFFFTFRHFKLFRTVKIWVLQKVVIKIWKVLPKFILLCAWLFLPKNSLPNNLEYDSWNPNLMTKHIEPERKLRADKTFSADLSVASSTFWITKSELKGSVSSVCCDAWRWKLNSPQDGNFKVKYLTAKLWCRKIRAFERQTFKYASLTSSLTWSKLT